MNQKEFSFEKLPDLITPRTLVEANTGRKRNAVYALFAKNNFRPFATVKILVSTSGAAILFSSQIEKKRCDRRAKGSKLCNLLL